MKKPLVKKENLDRILMLLPHLMNAEGNEWFKAEVKKLALTSEAAPNAAKDTLHSYSELDEQYIIINPNAWLIDYDEIPDENVRRRLKADCFEMARHRLGRGNHPHTPDFDEFCRHAHLQIEELVNYYYEKKFGNEIKKIISDILTYNKGAIGLIESSKELSRIPFMYKMWAVNDKFGLGSKSKTLMARVCKLRNELSHRTTLTKQSEAQIFETYERRNGLIRDMDPLTVHPPEVETILFRKQELWDEVVDAITKLKSRVVREI